MGCGVLGLRIGVAAIEGATGDVVNLFTAGEASVPGVAANAMPVGAFVCAQTDGSLSGSITGLDLAEGNGILGQAEHAVTAAGDVVRFTFAPFTVAFP